MAQSAHHIAQSSSQEQEHQFRSRKKHLAERIIERSIAVIAGVAIVLIFLILSFVLREALPLFVHSSPDTAQTPASSSASSSDLSALKPEVYNPDVILRSPDEEEFQPEVYNPDVSPPHPRSAGTAANGTTEDESGEITLENVLGTVWQPVSTIPKFGIMPLIIGTAKTTLVAIALGAPLGILAALYAAFLAPRWMREYIKPVIELLAGFPSVVIGFFCLLAVGSVVQTLFGLQYRLNAIVGGIGLAIAVIPIVFTITEDALSAVPKSLLEASLAIGATPWEAAYRVMLPAAFPGVFAAVLLGIGRAFGETMIALMATGNAALLSASFSDPARTLSATIGAEMGEVIWGSPHYSMLFFLGILLFAVSFTLNAITEFFVKERLAKRLQGQ
jgi:phosphate transport system permease protein